MASSPTELHRFASFDGREIVYRTTGEGRTVILLHGLFSNAEVNWLKFGHAAVIAAAGFRVVMPDLRAHGASAAPHDAEAYPPDVLARDGEALLAHLGLADGDYDLGGFSLGARTTMRMLDRGSRPRRAVVAGMGLDGVVDGGTRVRWFIDTIARRETVTRGSDEWLAIQFMKTTRTDPEAAAVLLRAHIDTREDRLPAIDIPVLVVCGAEDRDNGSAQELAAILPQGTYVEVPGTHMSSVAKPELGAAIAEYLAAP